MPWLLLALLGVGGGLYYETNKKPKTSSQVFSFGLADNPSILPALQAVILPLGGTVVNQGSGNYLITVPYGVDFLHALPPSLVPANGSVPTTVSGAPNEGLTMFGTPRATPDYILLSNDDQFAGGPQYSRNAGGGFDIAGTKSHRHAHVGSLLDGNPQSKAYYAVRVQTVDNKTRQRSYKWTPAQYIDPFSANQLAYNYKSTPGASVTADLFQYDFGRKQWLPVPGNSPLSF